MDVGLHTREAHRRLQSHGPNVIDQKEGISPLKLLVEQFLSPLIVILCVATLATLFIGDVVDAAVIFLAVIVNTSLGFFQEFKAQNALRALSQVLSPEASVWRDGHVVSIPIADIVPGDVVVIEAGVQVPADGVFLHTKDLVINEAILTGESIPVKKVSIRPENMDESFMAAPQDPEAQHYCYMGTTCLNGVGTLKVVKTGRQTEVGKIAKELSETRETDTPLQIKLKDFSKRLTFIVIGLAIAVFVFGTARGETPLEMLKLAVAIAVSAIPEGLVISLTVILAIGMQRILKRKALVRKLVAAETLGGITMICTDKTGTLTKGILSVFSVQTKQKRLMEEAGAILNSPTDPLEIAVRQWVEEQAIRKVPKMLDEVPFSAERKFTLKLTEDHVFMVGAPEIVLKHCEKEKQKEIEQEMLIFAKKGYRLVGVAARSVRKSESTLSVNDIGKFEWVGFFVLADQIRKEVAEAFQKLVSANIQVKVITGDHAVTAQAIMEEIGLELKPEEIMLGHEFKTLSLSQLTQKIQAVKLFARTTPDQKLVIVKTLQSLGEVVAMTGDGVNDAPALKQADIGVVVSSASDVSKETADIVLLDDNFVTIVAAVEEGRGIYENLRKVILYLLANSFAETIVVVMSLLFGLPIPITAIQILWVNLATDSLPSMALTIDPKEKNLLKRSPRSPKAELLDGEMKTMIGIISGLTGAFMSVVYIWLQNDYEINHLRSLMFTMLAMMSLLYLFSSKSLKQPIWRINIFQNIWLFFAVIVGFLLQLAVLYVPVLRNIFETVPLDLFDWGVILSATTVLLLVIELSKSILMMRKR
jgi:Ca2+-transporting ATPase